MSLVGLKHETEHLFDLTLSLNLPVLLGQAGGQPGQAGDGQPVLLGLVSHPVIELGISNGLEIHSMGEIHLAVLQISDSVIVTSNGLPAQGNLLDGGRPQRSQSCDGLIEQMDDVMQPRNDSKMNTVWCKILVDGTWKKVEIGWLIVAEGGRKLVRNPGKTLAIPSWVGTVQRRRDEHLKS